MDEKSDGERTRGSLGRRRKCPEAPSGGGFNGTSKRIEEYICIRLHTLINYTPISYLHTITHLLHYVSHKSVKMHQRIHLIFLIY